MTEAVIPAGRDFVASAAAVGAVAIGAVVLEAALIPGIVIGGAAVLAYRNIPGLRSGPLPRLSSLLGRRVAKRPAAQAGAVPPIAPSRRFAGFEIKQAVLKTITFRIIVTSLDFTTNYIVIGELATAAGLSAFSLAVGPLFYLAHEAVWNRYGPEVKRKPGPWSTAIQLPLALPASGDGAEAEANLKGFTISRALAKTITFRTIATVMDFSVNYVVVGDIATAALLSSTGFVLGPFVYLGHEMAWDRYGAGAQAAGEQTTPRDGQPA